MNEPAGIRTPVIAVGDHRCTVGIANFLGRCIIRTRIRQDMDAVPARALDYLGRITWEDDKEKVDFVGIPMVYSRPGALDGVLNHRIPDRSGAAFEIEAGASFQVVNPDGTQVADLVAFNRDDMDEHVSQGQTRCRNGTLRISTGDPLVTNRGNALLTITRDDCGVHDLMYPPCDEWLLNEPLFTDEPGGCLENLAMALEPWGITEQTVPQTLNAFQESSISSEYYLDVRPSPADPGDVLGFEVEMDAVVAVSSCSALNLCSGINGEKLTPIDLVLPDGTAVNDATVQTR